MKQRIHNSLLRSAIILFWITLVAIMLYLPKWQNTSSNTINVFAWGESLSQQLISEFTKKSGIRVNLNFYSSNEELLVKLRATEGAGYDLILPSDYTVQILIEENLVKPLDATRLSFLPRIQPYLMNHFFDPHNQFSIPFSWEIFGFGIDRDYFALHPYTPSWSMIFSPPDYKITMLNDPIPAVEMAALYLFQSNSTIPPDGSQQIRELLSRQKQWIEAYSDARGDYFLATKNCALVVASSSSIWRSMLKFSFIDFIIPQGGTFVSIENFCIPKSSDKDTLVYQFLNYLYREEAETIHFKDLCFFPATMGPERPGLDAKTKNILEVAEKEFKDYHFFHNLLPQEEMRDIWVEVKS